MTREKLIAYYEKQLEKVIIAYGTPRRGDSTNDINQRYIDHAKAELEAVKNGRNW